MFCTSCGTQIHDAAKFCVSCGTSIGGDLGQQLPRSAPPAPIANIKPSASEAIPAGVKGWSWGAFLLNWIWAIGNRTWWGLLAIIPYVGVIVALWLGVKGREMAWKNRKWDSLEHFNRVQKRWSKWGVGLYVGSFLVGILAAIAIPAYEDYVTRAKAAAAQASQPSASADNLNEPVAARREPNSTSSKSWETVLAATAEYVNKTAPKTVDKDTRLDNTFAGPGRKFTYFYTLVNLTFEDLDPIRVEEFSKTMRNRACTSKELEVFFENDTTINYTYRDKHGKFIKTIAVRPADCAAVKMPETDLKPSV